MSKTKRAVTASTAPERAALGGVFQGWANEETFLVNAWLRCRERGVGWRLRSEELVRYAVLEGDGERSLDVHYNEERASEALAKELEERMHNEAPEPAPGVLGDVYEELIRLALDRVDWLEIAGRMVSEARERVVEEEGL